MQTQKGFTLVELMVIVAVLLVLGAIGYSAFSGAGDRARTSSIIHGMKDFSGALERYYADTGCFPRSLVSLFDRTKNTASDTFCGMDVTARWQDAYIKLMPTDGSGRIKTDNFSPNSIATIGQDTTSVSGQTIYYVEVSNLPNELVKRVVAECNGTDRNAALPTNLANTQCMGSISTGSGSGGSGGGFGYVRMAVYRQ